MASSADPDNSITRPTGHHPSTKRAGTAAVLVVSDRAYTGERPDSVGPSLVEILEKAAFSVEDIRVVPDEESEIRRAIEVWTAESKIDLVVTTGGTGLGPRDVTPEAIRALAVKEIAGLAEAMRAHGLRSTPLAALSRQVAAVVGRSLVLALPGSPKGAIDSLLAVIDALPHALEMVRAGQDGHSPHYTTAQAASGSHSAEKTLFVTGLRDTPLDARALVDAIRRPDCGGLVSFEGTARSPSEGRDIQFLEYDAYRVLAEKQLAAIAREAAQRCGLRGVVAVHRVGRILPGETIVICAAAAPHRDAAFEGARYLIERIKAEAAIWKKEVFTEGSRWVGAEQLSNPKASKDSPQSTSG
jgi:molybdopterin adenylyltransferase